MIESRTPSFQHSTERYSSNNLKHLLRECWRSAETSKYSSTCSETAFSILMLSTKMRFKSDIVLMNLKHLLKFSIVLFDILEDRLRSSSLKSYPLPIDIEPSLWFSTIFLNVCYSFSSTVHSGSKFEWICPSLTSSMGVLAILVKSISVMSFHLVIKSENSLCALKFSISFLKASYSSAFFFLNDLNCTKSFKISSHVDFIFFLIAHSTVRPWQSLTVLNYCFSFEICSILPDFLSLLKRAFSQTNNLFSALMISSLSTSRMLAITR